MQRMNTKTFRGSDMSALLALVREEFGEDAIIVGSRTIGDDGLELDVALEDPSPMHAALAASTEVLSEVITLDTPYEPIARGERRNGVEEELLGQGISPALARVLSERVDARDAERSLAAALEGVLEFEVRLPLKKRVIGFFGATGVGKTTTIAKLAAQLQRVCHLKVGLICADTYRVGASFQLKSYASLLQSPFRCLFGTGKHLVELEDAIADLAHCDVVLVDFPGVSVRDTTRIDALARQCADSTEMERLLVLPAPGNGPDLVRVVEAFSPLGI
ncbi:MAG: Flagellar biosynthesis protein FlhF, partial [Pseudomonadota bacterium]